MKDKLLVMGAGGHAQSVVDVALISNMWQQISFLDDKKKDDILGFPILGPLVDAEKLKNVYKEAFVAIGNNELRMEWINRLLAWGYALPTLVHPHTWVGSKVIVGAGSVIMAGVCININTTIEEGCILNTGCTVDHNNNIGKCVHLSPGVHTGGNVTIESNTWVCTGASIGNGVHITHDCIVAAGAAVVRDIDEPGLYAGVPAVKKRGYWK